MISCFFGYPNPHKRSQLSFHFIPQPCPVLFWHRYQSTFTRALIFAYFASNISINLQLLLHTCCTLARARAQAHLSATLFSETKESFKMAPGKISKLQKPTGLVEASSPSFRTQERKPTRQSARLSKKAAPQVSNTHVGDEEHAGELELWTSCQDQHAKTEIGTDVRYTPFQNIKRVFKSCVEKITEKPASKRTSKKASSTETIEKVHQMLENELDTNHDRGELDGFICVISSTLTQGISSSEPCSPRGSINTDN